MGIFYTIKEQKEFKFIQFSKFFIIFNYSFYISFVLGILLTPFFPLNVLFFLIAVIVGITRTVMLFGLEYLNKSYLKEGSMFSISQPLSLKVFNKK